MIISNDHIGKFARLSIWPSDSKPIKIVYVGETDFAGEEQEQLHTYKNKAPMGEWIIFCKNCGPREAIQEKYFARFKSAHSEPDKLDKIQMEVDAIVDYLEDEFKKSNAPL